MPRLAPFNYDALSDEQKRIADSIVSGPRGGMRGPFQAWLNSPGMCEPAQELGAHARFRTGLPNDLLEMCILLTGKHWRAQFEFWAHARLARQAGLPEAVIEAIRTGETPTLDRDDLQVAYDVVTEHFATRRVSDANYARAIATFGEKGLVDIIATVGYYGLVSMTLNIFDVPLPDGEVDPV